MKKELFYVSASRARESITIVTSDKELLRHSVGCSGARQSAMELERRSEAHIQTTTARPGRQQGERRVRQAAAEEAGHGARHHTGVRIQRESAPRPPLHEKPRLVRSVEWER